MWQTHTFFLSALLGAHAVVADIVYVTDLPIFTSLAPCAAGALSYYVQTQTYKNCPEDVTALQSCICSQDNNSGAIAKSISTGVLGSCSSTATEDVASAASVYSAYCNQATPAAFPTPATPVSQYITDIAEMQYLAPCAYGAMSYDIMHMTYQLCPPDATALASCACSKNQNYLRISASINSDVKASCSSHTADIASAQAMFSAYCAMNNGTSAFPTPSSPPGQMTYYITALQEFSSLAGCAADAVSYAVQSQTYNLCPGGPEDLASCVCIKTGMPSYVSSLISTYVKDECTSTASAHITSALNVFAFYCSAALAEVTPTGVFESIANTTPAGSTPSAGGSKSGSSSSKSTNTAAGGGNSGGSSSSGSGSSNTAVIAGAVVGVVGGLALIGLGIFFLVRSIRRNKMNAAAAAAAEPPRPGTAPDNTYDVKPELGGRPLISTLSPPVPPVSPSPSMLKANPPPRMDNVSPASGHVSAYSPPPNKAELQGMAPPMPPGSAELHTPGGSPYQNGPAHTNAELHGQGAMYANRPELQGQGGSPYHQAPPHTNTELQGQSGAYPGRPELQGQGSPYGNRPELQGQGGIYPNRPELQGQGGPYPPGRPELEGQYAYQQPQGQGQQYYPPQGQPHPQQHPQQNPSELPSMGWHSGPVNNYHEMDGGYNSRGGSYGQGR